ncbi:50S ribosomal protein L24 [candidate division KSB1 bacterium]|nr:50S ribosomal protein L24 [candidate division KSB1 bacterium]MCH8286651.1 50S ribosomal protein L24 [candidate division KSB1 bacterium]
MNVVKEDTVLIISGNERGRQGKVLKTFPKTGRILVEGVNLIKRHTRPSQQSPQGGIVEKEATINASNVMVICPKCNNATRVKHKLLENNKSVRVCRNCEEMLTAAN